jgi:7-carboxy-7-deazaguanine synthase
LLETNGSLSVKDIPPEVIKIIDCKTPSSGEAGKMDFSNFSLIKSNDEIKFVIADRNDYDYSVKMKKEHKLPERTKNILFSPVWGKLPPEILAGWIVDDKLPVRFQVQLHKVLWGAGKRCV